MIQSRHIKKLILYAETPFTELSTQYANAQPSSLTIAQGGDYLLIASFQQKFWKNGQHADIALVISKISGSSNTEIDKASFNTSNWHFGFLQKRVTLSANDKVQCTAQLQKAVTVNISVRLSIIPA